MARYYDIYGFCNSWEGRLSKLRITHAVSEGKGYSLQDRGNGNPRDNTRNQGDAQ